MGWVGQRRFYPTQTFRHPAWQSSSIHLQQETSKVALGTNTQLTDGSSSLGPIERQWGDRGFLAVTPHCGGDMLRGQLVIPTTPAHAPAFSHGGRLVPWTRWALCYLRGCLPALLLGCILSLSAWLAPAGPGASPKVMFSQILSWPLNTKHPNPLRRLHITLLNYRISNYLNVLAPCLLKNSHCYNANL